MDTLQPIIAEYTQLREKGKDTKSALDTLRPKIEPLTVAQRQELAQRIRSWEVTNTPLSPKPTVRPIHPPPASEPVIRKLSSVPQDDVNAKTCPHCGKPNAKDDVLCYSCGQLLEGAGTYETHKLAESDERFHRDDYYGTESTLVLVVDSDAQKAYKIRLQEQTRDYIIGRDAGETMKPDLDLSPYKADTMGVSRMHLSMRYDVKHETVCVTDLGSANGSFINGQRLHPHEVRVLRHGDELKLGKVALKVYFHHPENGTRS